MNSVSFKNGPASGKTLRLYRAPYFLRVVWSPGLQDWDALDLLDDEPCVDEKLVAYRMAGQPMRMHLNYGGGRGEWLDSVEYVAVDPQPADEDMRMTDAWHRWTAAHAPENTINPLRKDGHEKE